ncbi:MAG: hypothetical protein AB7Q29_05330 [Vicinamibacterales bacterium]
MSRLTSLAPARTLHAGACLLAAVVLVLSAASADAQTRFSYSSGQPLEPAYEGWWPNEDGSFTLFFGYMNTNWRQEFDIPVGADNHFEPGEPDRGQPTHFYPRRNPFLFTVHVPKDFGTQEMTWTVTANGQTRKAYASLKTDYLIDKQVISTEVGGDNGSLANELRENTPPDVKLEGAIARTVKVGKPMSLVAIVGDPDGYPPRRDGKPQPGVKKPLVTAVPSSSRQNREDPTSNSPTVVYKPTTSTNESSGPGLRFSWTVYRGTASAVTFKPDQLETWIDTRSYAHSPWAPPYIIPVPPADGRYATEVTFSEPGVYVLRAVASDSALFTYENVTVTVTP